MFKKIIVSSLVSVLALGTSIHSIANAVTTRPNPIVKPYTNVGTFNSTYRVYVYPFTIKNLTAQTDDPYYYDFVNGKSVEELTKPVSPFLLDKNGMPMIQYGGSTYYHPVRTAGNGLYYLNAYKQLNKPEYLEKAKQYANHLATLSASYSDGSLFFAYKFKYTVLGRSTETLTSPWFSAMSQGQALSLYIRIYQVTKETKYLTYANRTLKSMLKFVRTMPGAKPWVTTSDGYQYEWLEEYPTETKAHNRILNGFIFALYGLYDYYNATGNTIAKTYLQGGMTTILAYGDRYRLPNNYSYYGLKYNNAASSTYHNIHIRQLKQLYKMTGDIRFNNMSTRFYNDTVKLTTSSTTSSTSRSLAPASPDTKVKSGFTSDEIETFLNQKPVPAKK
ncbi:D-glucuronyl C5-epimerase family protein [Shimazuella kribbensis]|uniref:D-glucuronyl C5-epimerase family protein n=1 Tax=Shimazuella kribbensis TaxID=139808 RepID=UPI0003FB177D|nr:D-glucuronyl C5-epimerase family protein [Shimazuella kribbensis]